ncbi:hypothetical protein ACFX14_027818 [Malus domestica]
MGIPDEEQANHQNIDQHETSLNPAASTRSKRSGGRHLLTEEVKGSKAIFHDCRDFLKQLRNNLIHVSSKINDPMVSEIDIPRQQHVNEVSARNNPIHVSSKINDPMVSEIDIPRQQHVNEVSAISELKNQMANLTILLSQVVEIPKVQSVAACGVCLMQ